MASKQSRGSGDVTIYDPGAQQGRLDQADTVPGQAQSFGSITVTGSGTINGDLFVSGIIHAPGGIVPAPVAALQFQNVGVGGIVGNILNAPNTGAIGGFPPSLEFRQKPAGVVEILIEGPVTIGAVAFTDGSAASATTSFPGIILSTTRISPGVYDTVFNWVFPGFNVGNDPLNPVLTFVTLFSSLALFVSAGMTTASTVRIRIRDSVGNPTDAGFQAIFVGPGANLL